MARQAVLELVADASRLRATLKTAEGDTDRFGSKMGALGGVIAGALTGAALVSFGKSAVTAFTESEQAQSQLNVALGNSPATVGVTAKAFENYNKVLARKTLVDDDAIASGQAVLAGFGLTEEQLKQMTPVLVDYAAKTGKDLPSAAEDLGKAMLGQGRALKAIGVDFDDTGTHGGNFAQIMGEVGGKVDGAAKAQLDAAGPGATMKKSMDELQESVGKVLVPALQSLARIVSTVIDFFAGLSDPIKIAIGVFGALAAGVYLIVQAKKAWVAIQAALNVVMALNPIALVVIAVVALVAIIVVAYQKSETFRDIVNGAFSAVKNVVMGVYNWVKDNWPLLLAILTGPIGLAVLAIVKHWDTIKDAFTAVKDWISEKIGDIVGFITGIPGRITGVASTMWDGIKAAFTAVKDWIGERIGDIVGFITGLPGRIAGAASTMWDGIKTAFTGVKNWIGNRINDIVGFVTGLPGRIASAASGMFDSISGAFKAMVNAIASLWNNTAGRLSFKAPDWVPGIGGKGFDMPDIPTMMAAGGIVTRPTLAMIGEAGPEAVIPLSRFGGRTGTTIVNNYFELNVATLDPVAAAPVVVAAIREYERRNGQGWRT